MTPTQRTIHSLKEQGWTVEVVEHWNSFAKVRHDLFGFIDVLAISEAEEFLAVQCTGGGNGPARVKKILANPKAYTWVSTGARLQVWDWKKLLMKNKHGKRTKQRKYICDVTEITILDFA